MNASFSLRRYDELEWLLVQYFCKEMSPMFRMMVRNLESVCNDCRLLLAQPHQPRRLVGIFTFINEIKNTCRFQRKEIVPFLPHSTVMTFCYFLTCYVQV